MDDGAEIIAVDYKNVAAIQETLEKYNIDTVVSCLMILDDDSGKAQVNLIEAAAASSATNRIIVSDYSFPYPDEYESLNAGWKQN